MAQIENNNEENKLSVRNWLIIALVVFFIILTVGLFFWGKEQKRKQKFVELQKKKDRLIIVKGEILELEKKKEILEQREKHALIAGRALIAVLLLFLNICYTHYYMYPFDFTRLLDFNGSILLGYSFVAFVSYGTPTNFANNIKKKLFDTLKENHIDSLEELKQLIIEKENLISEISIMESEEVDDDNTN